MLLMLTASKHLKFPARGRREAGERANFFHVIKIEYHNGREQQQQQKTETKVIK